MRFADSSGKPAWALDAGNGQRLLAGFSLTRWLSGPADVESLLGASSEPTPEIVNWLPPIEDQEVWAAGVTYLSSRDARQEESVDGGDVYARVYHAERPELFYKGNARTVVGHLAEIGIRSDSNWNVPEPELGLVLNGSMQVVGLTIGNDVSSRSIEGENPLYLPQAKVYRASCALGPGIVLTDQQTLPSAAIEVTISREEVVIFHGETHTSRIKRTAADLIAHLGHSNPFDNGVVLLTGTGIVPPAEITLLPADRVDIRIEGLGTLTNFVKLV
jgi:2-dehydro-3-deoxy-D-arabinonate dehydratase